MCMLAESSALRRARTHCGLKYCCDRNRLPAFARSGSHCTGSELDYRRVDSHLMRSLFAKGWLQANPLGLGVRTVENGAVVDRDGAVLPWLHAIGP